MKHLGNRQLFFLHIPKTGGLTLRGILSRYFTRQQVCSANGLGSLLKMSDEEIGRYRYFRGHIPYNATQLMPRSPLIITFLRDPFERTLSNYAYLRSRDDLRLHPIAATYDLVGYLKNARASYNQTDMMTYFIGANFPIRGVPNRDKHLDLAMRRLEHMPFVGITERYDESVQLLAHVLDIAPMQQIEKRNVSPERLRINDLTAEEYALIDEMTQNDQRLYAYARQLFDARYQAFVQATQMPQQESH